jgi:iron-sulfur cluster assembly accessory protein
MTTPSMSMTEAAARRINEIMAGEPSARLLRIRVEGGGCSGFQYKFDLVSSAEADDLVIERDGAQVAIDQVSLPFLLGARLDFVDQLIGAQFKLDNPNAQASCGCGTSFSV